MADIGRKIRDYLTVPGTDVVLPLTRVDGIMAGPTLLVTAGVHGGEYAPIEAAIRFASALEAERIKGQVLVVHLTNPLSFFAKSQYVVPRDGKNLNRVFPGVANGTVSERIAFAISRLASTADYWVDMHAGDIHEALVPFVIFSDQGDPRVVSRSKAMAQIYGIEYIVQSAAIGGGTYAAGARMGIPSILAEAGQLAQVDEGAVTTHLRGLENVLRYLEMVAEKLDSVSQSHILHQFAWVDSPATGLFYRSIQAGDVVRVGVVAGVVRNPFGDIIEEIRVPQDGVVLFVVTSLAINAGEPLFAVASP